MNQTFSRYLHIAAGIGCLLIAGHLLLQFAVLIFGLYCLFTGFNMQKDTTQPIVFIRSLFARFSNRFW